MQKKLKTKFFLKFLIFFFFSSDIFSFEKKILGCFCEGGLIYSNVPQNSKVFIDDKKIQISEDGYFIYAFGRNYKDTVKIRINDISTNFQIKKKKYLIEKIRNLPNNKVSPDEKSLKKIRIDQNNFKKAKTKDINKKFFTDDFILPVIGRISGKFGSQRILNGKPRRPHYGLDIAAKIGTKIVSPSNGKVKFISQDMFFTGKTIIVDHGLGLISIFAHLSDINVKKNDLVFKGDLIGKVGKTGRATGPHLHWGIYLEKIPVDPEVFLN